MSLYLLMTSVLSKIMMLSSQRGKAILDSSFRTVPPVVQSMSVKYWSRSQQYWCWWKKPLLSTQKPPLPSSPTSMVDRSAEKASHLGNSLSTESRKLNGKITFGRYRTSVQKRAL